MSIGIGNHGTKTTRGVRGDGCFATSAKVSRSTSEGVRPGTRPGLMRDAARSRGVFGRCRVLTQGLRKAAVEARRARTHTHIPPDPTRCTAKLARHRLRHTRTQREDRKNPMGRRLWLAWKHAKLNAG